MDQEVLFGQRAYTDPWGTLRELQQADMRQPSAGRKARMAALHAVVGDLVESVMLAGAVVQASEPVASLERARAHVSLAASWAAAGGLNVPVRGMTPRQHIAAGLRILAEADPGGGYLTAASLINAATAEYAIGDLDAAYRHLGRARGLVSSWGKSAPMRGPYLGLIEFNTVVMADLDERSMVAALLGVHDQARREGVLRTCGLVDQTLAGRFAAAHLYTPALLHGERAREIWHRCRRPERVASIDYTLLEIYKNLGAEEERERLERQLIGITRPESVFRGIATQAKAKVSEHYHDLADYRRSEQYEESAWKTIEPVLKAEGGHVTSGGALGLVFGGVRTARKLGDDRLVAKWRSRAAFMARGIDAYLESSTGWGASFGRYLEAIIDGDRQAVATLQQEIVRKTLEVNAYGKAALPAVIALQEHLDTVEPGDDLDTDLREYWQHLRSLASEDAEEIRSRFRSANVVPVLNRILGSNPDLDPWIQFETVELARTGSVTGPQAVGLPDKSLLPCRNVGSTQPFPPDRAKRPGGNGQSQQDLPTVTQDADSAPPASPSYGRVGANAIGRHPPQGPRNTSCPALCAPHGLSQQSRPGPAAHLRGCRARYLVRVIRRRAGSARAASSLRRLPKVIKDRRRHGAGHAANGGRHGCRRDPERSHDGPAGLSRRL
ncbi:hypothetical protein [Actinacidiphila glaucinigra]|nr:hypothetical protein [Actinacidiphila glaucinigra]